MGGRVAHEEEGVGVGLLVARGGRDDGEARIGGDGGAQVGELAVDPGAEGGLGEAGADVGGHQSGGDRTVVLPDRSVGQRDAGHGVS